MDNIQIMIISGLKYPKLPKAINKNWLVVEPYPS